MISAFSFTAFSHAEALSSYTGKKNFSFKIHAIQTQKVLSFCLMLYQTFDAESLFMQSDGLYLFSYTVYSGQRGTWCAYT